jgi:hypothetical protein
VVLVVVVVVVVVVIVDGEGRVGMSCGVGGKMPACASSRFISSMIVVNRHWCVARSIAVVASVVLGGGGGGMLEDEAVFLISHVCGGGGSGVVGDEERCSVCPGGPVGGEVRVWPGQMYSMWHVRHSLERKPHIPHVVTVFQSCGQPRHIRHSCVGGGAVVVVVVFAVV